jgi:cytochrome P450
VRGYTERLLRPIANRLIDGFAGRGELDLVAEYTRRLPVLVITGLLGVPNENERQLIEWIEGLFSYPWNPEFALRAKDEVTAFFLPIIHARRAEPREDPMSLIAAAEFEGHRLTDEEVLAFVRLLFPAGADTTYLALGSIPPDSWVLFGIRPRTAIRRYPRIRSTSTSRVTGAAA